MVIRVIPTYNSIPYFQFPSNMLFPNNVDDIIDGNLSNVEIIINLDDFIGSNAPMYIN